MSGILRTYRVNTTARGIEFFLERYPAEPRFDMEQPYQRGLVWGERRKQNLIKSILMGIPIPAIVINDRFGAGFTHPGYNKDRNWKYAIVDGKQRVSTIQGFVGNEFWVPREWFEDEPVPNGLARDQIVYYDDLTLPQRRGFRNIPIPVAEGQFATLDQERELFDLVNFGGLAQGERDDDVAAHLT